MQGHSGKVTRTIERVGQTRVDATTVPKILMHSTMFDHKESIISKGLLPGGLRANRNDNYFVDAADFAENVAQSAAREGPDKTNKVAWQDPVHKMHMRTIFDIVMMYSGTLMIKNNATIWRSAETKDFMFLTRLSTFCAEPRERTHITHQ